jgi:hypothetical protein
MKSLKMYVKLEYCEVNKESNLHIANGTCNLGKLPKGDKNMPKYPLLQ